MVQSEAGERDLGPLAGAGAPGFAVILVEPQLGQNIGMAARAMANCGLGELRLVAPRDGWPNPASGAAAAGADRILDQARVFATTADAVADLHTVLATTARPRDMTKDVLTPGGAAALLRAEAPKGARAGVLFGKESIGLHNDDVALAAAVVTVPLNALFSSLNLAQAVFVICYEWSQAADATPAHELVLPKETRPADLHEMTGLFEHLEAELDACGFLRNQEKRPIMVRNIRNIFQRARLSEQEVRTFRGIISGLAKFPRKPAE